MILYVETNFLIGSATGRDTLAFELLHIPENDLRIAIPSLCFAEAWIIYERFRKEHNKFDQQLQGRIHELRRDFTSAHAKNLILNLEEARTHDSRLLDDIYERLALVTDIIAGEYDEETLGKYALRDRSSSTPGSCRPAEILPLSPEIIVGHNELLIVEESLDNLVLWTIDEHARSHASDEKILLSENSNDFGRGDASDLLGRLGVRYFASTGAFLGWYRAQTKLGSSA